MTVAARAVPVVAMALLVMTGPFTDELTSPAPRRTMQAVVPTSCPAVVSVHQAAALSDNTTQPNTDADADPTVDFYGNEVTVAVVKYKIDAAGRLYELHSSQSALPRLGSPKS